MNEPEEGVAPTDSRLRPDQRLMEEGRWDEANAEKLRLEEKQRASRRAREHEAENAAAQGRFMYIIYYQIAKTFKTLCSFGNCFSAGLPYEPYEPLWFKKKQDPYTDSRCYVYNGEYWDCKSRGDWSRCPNIF